MMKEFADAMLNTGLNRWMWCCKLQWVGFLADLCPIGPGGGFRDEKAASRAGDVVLVLEGRERGERENEIENEREERERRERREREGEREERERRERRERGEGTAARAFSQALQMVQLLSLARALHFADNSSKVI